MIDLLRDRLQSSLGGAYTLERELGGGGMSRVFVARDEALGRRVVVKVLTPELAQGLSAERFAREIKLAAALQEPHIVPVLSAGATADGLPYYTMPYVQGESLRHRLASGPLPLDEAVGILADVARALAYAHRQGIVHRDVKPENVLLHEGTAVVTDFGIARALSAARGERARDLSAGALTAVGTSLGTPAYMAPEQAAGDAADHRADLYAWGMMAYELLAGAHPFADKRTAQQLIAAQIAESPPPLGATGRRVPPPLAAAVMRCLNKDPERRFAHAGDLIAALEAARRGGGAGGGAVRRLPLVAAGAVLLLTAAGGAWWWQRASERTWARAEALPGIRRLAAAERYEAAAALAARADRVLPGDSALAALWQKITAPASVEATPAGAQVFVRDYADTAGAWRALGAAPVRDVRLPRGVKRWRFEAPGHRTLLRAAEPGTLRVALTPNDARVPPEMVAVPGGPTRAWITGVDPIGLVTVDDYLVDRHEVTNREYKRFVDAGGYARRELWTQPFVRDGKSVPWEEAMRAFRDPTGRPGPSTWRLGGYASGQDDVPVTGVSWYEAAAYAQFAGKSLPTIHHWVRAASTPLAAQMIPLSNFAGRGLAPVERHRGMSAYGAHDMAGNAREWLWNSAGPLRHILGGAWNEPAYMFTLAGAAPPFDRSPANGFRCVRYRDGRIPAATGGDYALAHRDLEHERPVSDDVFRVYLTRFAYDPTPLDARVEPVRDSLSRRDTVPWSHEKVSFAAAYGGERVTVHLFLPKGGRPPYQPVVIFPGSTAIFAKQSDDVVNEPPYRFHIDFLTRSGRAVVYPIYKGTYERNDGFTTTWPNPSHQFAEYEVRQVQDFRRTVDYLAARREFDLGRLAYLGVSWGARMAAMIPAVEPRVKLVVATGGGIAPQRALPEVDDFNYLGRVRVPVLMLNGRYDAVQPVESAQLPMFRMLGTPARDKRHVLFDSGHYPLPEDPYVREVLEWLDRYLGPT